MVGVDPCLESRAGQEPASVFLPVRDHLRAGMHTHLSQDSFARINELVRGESLHQDDLHGAHLQCGVAQDIGGLAFRDRKYLLIGMTMPVALLLVLYRPRGAWRQLLHVCTLQRHIRWDFCDPGPAFSSLMRNGELARPCQTILCALRCVTVLAVVAVMTRGPQTVPCGACAWSKASRRRVRC